MLWKNDKLGCRRRRRAAGARGRDARARETPRQRPPHRAAVPGGHRAGAVRHGLLLGCGAHLLEDGGGVQHGGRLRGGDHAQSDVSRGLLRHDRTQRGRARGLRARRGSLRGSIAGVLGAPRSDPGHAARNDAGTQYRPASTPTRPRAARAAIASRDATSSACAPPVSARSPPDPAGTGVFTTPRGSTSSTWRIPAATAAWAVLA